MSETHVRCPTCRRTIASEREPFRPFCSERCRLIDLGAWFTEQRRIPGENSAADAPGQADWSDLGGDFQE
jgi:uncharacterized protein